MNFIGLDIETAGTPEHPEYSLQPWRVKTGEARITALSVVGFVGQEDRTLFSGLEPTRDQIRDLLINLNTFQKDPVLTGWNMMFDAAWLIAYGFEDLMRQMKWADAQIFRRALENTVEKTPAGHWGLKKAVHDFLPDMENYADEIKERNDWSIVDDTLLRYNRDDSLATARLARSFFGHLSDRQRILCNVVNSSIIPLAAAWVNGININPDALDTWSAKIEGARAKSLQTLITEHGLDSDKVLTSHVQLKSWLHQKGFMVECTDRNELTKFSGNALMDQVIAFKRANGHLTKFINGTRESLDYNGGTTTHPQGRLWNTYTGRDGYSSTQEKKYQVGIAIHQWPKRGDSTPRTVIRAPQGYKLCECDFSTQESRLLADYSDDPILLDIFRSGLDFHSYMASVIDGCDYATFVDCYKHGDKDAQELRQCAKVVNLSLTYRASWRRLIDMARKDYDVIFTPEQAQRYHRLYRSTYELVPEYWQRSIRTAQIALQAETRGGRTVLIKDWSRDQAWSSESTALNFPIQGTGADMKALGRGIIDPILYKNGGRYLLDLHDALFFLVPDNADGERLARRCQMILSNLPYEKVFGWTPKVPMPVDLKIGYVWADLEDVPLAA